MVIELEPLVEYLDHEIKYYESMKKYSLQEGNNYMYTYSKAVIEKLTSVKFVIALELSKREIEES